MKNLHPPYQAATVMPFPIDQNISCFHSPRLPVQDIQKSEPVTANDLNALIIQTQEAERKKISEELHDNICQTLGAVKLFIDQMLEAGKLKRRTIRKCSVYLHEVINELRHVSHTMGMVWLQEHCFCKALQKFVGMMQELKRITIRLDMEHFDDSGLDSHHQLIVFRIIQEQVHNVLKHARASDIHITLRKTSQTGYLRIADNGIGADYSVASVKEGAGLKNIRHRVEIIAGHMAITTAPGEGFILEVTFPFNSNSVSS